MRTKAPLLGFAAVAIAAPFTSPSLGATTEPVASPSASGYGLAPGLRASASGRPRPLILAGSGAPSRLSIRPSGRRFVVLESPGGVGELGERCRRVSPTVQKCRVGDITYIGLRGFGGRDRIQATDGVRVQIAILGGKGRDVLGGGGADDGLDGGPGNDRIIGRGDGDLLRGRGGNDRLAGGPGNDTVNGGGGRRDLCGGGPGADLIVKCP